MHERKGELEGLSWRRRSGRGDDECRRNGFGQVWRWLCRLIYPELRGSATNQVPYDKPRGVRSVLRVVASSGKAAGRRNKPIKSAAVAYFYSKNVMVKYSILAVVGRLLGGENFWP